MKSPRRLALLAALCGTLAAWCGTVVLAGWVAAGLAGRGSPARENTGAPVKESRATSVIARAEPVDAPQATALGEDGVSAPGEDRVSVMGEDGVSVAPMGSGGAALPDSRPMPPPGRIASLSTPDPVQNEAKETASSGEVADMGSGGAALPDPRPMLASATSTMQLASLSPPDAVQNAAKPAVSSFEALAACLEPDVCIDQYLWSLYERAHKVDTVKVTERIKVTIEKKGKKRTVVKTLTKYVTEDFAWKDPAAAQKAGMSLQDYVIGGMDRGFKRKLYHALRAMDDAGLSPGITSAFRDDYRQGIATGIKAATGSSYHGGSRYGGYGHGLAADLVSVKGETRAERGKSSEILWKWIDAHEQELGIGRPYLDRDPPHVAPIDGKEYAAKRGRAKTQLAGSAKTRRAGSAANDTPGMTKSAKAASR
jgi:hypothetical protein